MLPELRQIDLREIDAEQSHDLRHVNLGQVDAKRAEQLALLRREQRLYRFRIKKLLNTQLLCALKRSAERLSPTATEPSNVSRRTEPP